MKRPANILSWQLLKEILSIYFAITVGVTLVQMWIEYQHTRITIQSELQSVERTFYPALVTALWELNSEQLKSIERGIIDLPIISGLTIVNAAGKELSHATEETPLGVNVSHQFKVSYHFSGEEVPLADVVFLTAGDVVFDRLKIGYQMILLSALIKSIALTLLFFWAFRRRLGIPLEQLTNAVAKIDLKSLGCQQVDLKQAKKNELTRLENTFNLMLRTLDEERKTHDAALETLNKGLEAQVRKRTEELEIANRRLEQQARTDPLTGVANRRHFVEQAQIEIQRAQRTKTPLSILMIDLDLFKRINDTWGHAAGDEVLRNFTTTASTPLRSSDLLARLGGEEFAVLLPNTDLEGAGEVALRILEAAGEQAVTCHKGDIRYTVSIGMAELQAGENNYESLLHRADSALYRAKETGRNRIEIATEKPGK